jgi:hypothetical protein
VEGWCGDKGEGQDDAAGHACSFGLWLWKESIPQGLKPVSSGAQGGPSLKAWLT